MTSFCSFSSVFLDAMDMFFHTYLRRDSVSSFFQKSLKLHLHLFSHLPVKKPVEPDIGGPKYSDIPISELL